MDVILDKKPNELNLEEIKKFLNGEIAIRVDNGYLVMQTPDKIYLRLRGLFEKEND